MRRPDRRIAALRRKSSVALLGRLQAPARVGSGPQQATRAPCPLPRPPFLWAKGIIKWINSIRKELKVDKKQWALMLLDLYSANRDEDMIKIFKKAHVRLRYVPAGMTDDTRAFIAARLKERIAPLKGVPVQRMFR